MRQLVIVSILFFCTSIYADMIEVISFDAPYTGTGPYYENGMIIERNPSHIPLFYPLNSGILNFSESNGPVTFDGSNVVFGMENTTFDLLSIDIVQRTASITNFTIFANNQSLRFNAFGPSEGIIRPTVGTHSLQEYSFFNNISTFSITGSGFYCFLDNITFQTASVPEPSVINLSLICMLLFGCFIKKDKC